MKLLIDILYYVLGIGLPLLIILVALFKKSKQKVLNIIEKTIIAIIIGAIFYILRIGINSYCFEREHIMVNSNNNIVENNDNNKDNSIDNVKDSETENKNEENEIVIEVIDGVTYANGILIVNKTYSLPEDFVPKNTYKDVAGLSYSSEGINKDAYLQFQEMKADATSIGLNIWIQSGYRSYELQDSLYNRYVNQDGKLAADTYSARPGHSEHQTGLAFDLNTIDDSFQYTDEGKWINENAYRYGFILRYPKGKDDITGYKYESWHLRYVGKELAKILYNNGEWITLEEHFKLESKYEN